ncbi:hypothetical protein LSTR_LSTR003761 [Laodelphax striatellus]|uniref:Uncharacterized protein n=1 Tax=Laodelphax striatellus TaxID=195883 RepID=A0A482WQ65_LAOST|nr:hypothetical protein LSTR_LSTR003761 [Laodelphax striatellus]
MFIIFCVFPTFQALTYDELGLLSYRIVPTPETVYKGVIEKPLIIVTLVDEKPSFQFAPGGLRNLLKDPESKRLALQLTDDDRITVVIYQKSSLPSAMFPEMLRTTLKVPKYTTTLQALLEPPPVVVLISKNELQSLNFHGNLGKVSDLILEGNDIRVGRDLRQPMNHYAPPATSYNPHHDNYGPAAPHFAPIPALPPLNIPNNVGPFYI